MRLFNLFMERDGRKVPLGTFVSGSDTMSQEDLPVPPTGVRYLDPEEVLNTDAYVVAIRRYEELARSCPPEEARAAVRTADALKRRMHELRCRMPH